MAKKNLFLLSLVSLTGLIEASFLTRTALQGFIANDSGAPPSSLQSQISEAWKWWRQSVDTKPHLMA